LNNHARLSALSTMIMKDREPGCGRRGLYHGGTSAHQENTCGRGAMALQMRAGRE
jgi:uncharacterized protein YbbK (DUF523 family)